MNKPSFSSERMKPQAERLIDYFSSLSQRHGIEWDLGLFMAKQWRRMLHEPQPDIEEARLLFSALESQRMKQGSGWKHLWYLVKGWIEEIDPECEAFLRQTIRQNSLPHGPLLEQT